MDSQELMTFATRVLERALQKSGYMPAPPDDPNGVKGPGDMFVDNLADKLIGVVMRADAAALPQLQSAFSSPALEQLRVRNALLANALGACECFGEDQACVRCGGRGAPGWHLPDRPHFEAIVRPALQRVSQFRHSARHGHLQSLQR